MMFNAKVITLPSRVPHFTYLLILLFFVVTNVQSVSGEVILNSGSIRMGEFKRELIDMMTKQYEIDLQNRNSSDKLKGSN